MSRARLAVLLFPLLVPLLVGASAGPASAAPPSLTYACSPAPTNCAGWYRGAVDLAWDWDNTAASPSDGNCSDQHFSADTPGTEVFCEVKSKTSQEWTGRAVTIKIDQTAPTVSGGLARPPDYGGWFNHPVGFRFFGRDATSGIRSCSSGTYSGPDRAGVRIAGSCRDVAGNVTVRSLSLNYDGIPPSPLHVDVTPGNRKVTLRWSAPEAVSAQVFRWRTGVAPKLVFSGGGNKYTDRGLRNRRRYQYGLLVTDRAGNRAGTNLTAVPTASKLLSPPPGARVRRPPLLKWKRVRRARYYNVQLYRISGGSASSVQIAGSRKVISRWPRRTRLQLRRSWRYGGKRQHLSPGRYRWFVWPGYGRRSANRYGRLLGKSSFTVVR
jgi:hypothetical protein